MACLGCRAGAAGRFCATVGGCTGGGCRWQGGTWIYTRRGDGRHKRCPITRWLWPNVFNAITLPTLCTITNGCMTCLSHPRHVQEHACPDICALARSNVARASPSGPSVVHLHPLIFWHALNQRPTAVPTLHHSSTSSVSWLGLVAVRWLGAGSQR